MRIVTRVVIVLGLLAVATAQVQSQDAGQPRQPAHDEETWKQIAFQPPPALAADLGDYRSPLVFDDGRSVKTPEDWQRRRQEILKFWHASLGAWPPLINKPAIETVETSPREDLAQNKVRIEAAEKLKVDGYLLIPKSDGPCPAVLVVYYEPETGIGLGKSKLRDFAYQLARRGFVALSIGWPTEYTKQQSSARQPLSSLAYVAANCYNALASLREVDPARVGVVGHSFGGKWALFASCLYEKFACGVWSDPGIVFDEKRPNINYWEPWYLGWDSQRERKPGVPTENNPRTGPYKQLFEAGHDLHELHALMAPRPFLVSGGSEDPPERWKALNHSIAVNRLLGHENRVAMTNRPAHSPTEASNEQIYLFFEHFLKPADHSEQR